MNEGQAVLRSKLERLEGLVELTNAAVAALKGEESGAAELEVKAAEAQEMLAKEEEAEVKAEAEERELREAAERASRAREESERAKAEAETKAKIDQERLRAELEAAQLETSESLNARISEEKELLKSLQSGAVAALNQTIEQKLGTAIVKKNLKPKEMVQECCASLANTTSNQPTRATGRH